VSPFIRHLAPAPARAPRTVVLAVLATLFCWSCDGIDPPPAPPADPTPELVSRQRAAIVRGEPAADSLPSLAAIVLRESNAGEERLAVICSGTLIEPRVVLTAAHCVDRHGPARAPAGIERRWFVSFEADLTGLGRDDLELPPDAIPVSGTRGHPGFSPAENTRVGLGPSHDLGLVFLDEPVADRTPSALVSPEAALALGPGTTVIVAGYGSRSPEGAAAPEDGPGLKTAGTAAVLEVGSHELRVGRPDQPTTPHERSLADKCGGDSGGPTFLQVRGEPVLVGLSSRGYDSSPRCERASIDLRVDVFLPWILEQVAAHGALEAKPAAPGCSAGGKVGVPAGGPGSGLLLLALLGFRPRGSARGRRAGPR
jgi:hypothetical protein